MLGLEGSHLGFLLFKLYSRIRQLVSQKRCRTLGELLLGSHVFVDKQRSKLAVYLLGKLRRPRGILNLEGSKLTGLTVTPRRLYQFNLYIPAHRVHRVRWLQPARQAPVVRI